MEHRTELVSRSFLRVFLVACLGVSGYLLIPACSPPSGDGDGDGDADGDADVTCEAGLIDCAGETYRRCNDSGDGWADQYECTDPTPLCVDNLGCVMCRPHTGDCDGDTPRHCNAEGTGWDVDPPCDAAAGHRCQNGACLDPCAAAADSNSYVGCEYWAVDLPNAQQSGGTSPQLANFAVVISNGHETATAQVEVFANGDESIPIMAVAVPPMDLRTLEINPAVNAADSSLSGTGIHRDRAFHIVSNLPVTAYQFNPLNNTDAAYSNDASLLLPESGLDRTYIVATADGMQGGDSTNPAITYEWGAFVTVVAVNDGTEVTVAPTVHIQGGDGIERGNDPVTVTLDRFDVLNIESMNTDLTDATPGNANLSGTFVEASSPVAVFAGNVATIVPYGPDGACCADHVEEQMIPLSSWGQDFVVARGMARRSAGNEEPEYYRVTGGNVPAGQDVIHLNYHPSAPAGAPTELTQGQSVEFSTTTDFAIDADGPLLVTSYFVSSFFTAPEINPDTGAGAVMCLNDAQCGGLPYAAVCFLQMGLGSCVPIGDPSMTIIPPVEQYRDSYVFLAPLDYAHDAITVIAPTTSVVRLDGAPLGAMTVVGEINGIAYGVVRQEVTDGTHRLVADGGAEVGLIVYGMDKDVSYGYPGGLDLEVINIF